jgi:hypothetical protein
MSRGTVSRITDEVIQEKQVLFEPTAVADLRGVGTSFPRIGFDLPAGAQTPPRLP